MGDRDFAASRVIDRQDGEVLDESASAPDVEDLNAEADGEDGLVKIVRVLEEEFVDVFTRRVSGGALGDWILTVFVRVHVGGTAWEENGLAGVDEICDLDWCCEERDFDWLSAAAFHSLCVLRPGALVVGDVGAGGDGNCDAGTRMRRGVHQA